MVYLLDVECCEVVHPSIFLTAYPEGGRSLCSCLDCILYIFNIYFQQQAKEQEVETITDSCLCQAILIGGGSFDNFSR